MRDTRHSEMVERSLHASFQAVRYVLTIGLFGSLILAWVLTAPLFRCGIFLGDACRRWELRTKNGDDVTA